MIVERQQSLIEQPDQLVWDLECSLPFEQAREVELLQGADVVGARIVIHHARQYTLGWVMSILIGTQGWNYEAWVGPFYPRDTRPAEFLSTYARAFRAVEVD